MIGRLDRSLYVGRMTEYLFCEPDLVDTMLCLARLSPQLPELKLHDENV